MNPANALPAGLDRFFERRPDGQVCPKGVLLTVLRASKWVTTANMHLQYRMLPFALAAAGVDPVTATTITTFLRTHVSPERLAEMTLMGACTDAAGTSARQLAGVVGDGIDRHVAEGLGRGRRVRLERCGCSERLARALTGAPRMAAEHLGRQVAAGGNWGTIWRYFTTSVYQSGDLPVIATREALQNARDAGAKSFKVKWWADENAISWEDDGKGMDADTIEHKFLSLGESGKSDATSSDDATGGFGVAKAVILGVSNNFTWTLESHDVLVSAQGMSNIRFSEDPVTYRKGVRIWVDNVDPKFRTRWDQARGKYAPIAERLSDMLSFCDLPNMRLECNDTVIEPAFPRRGGTRVQPPQEWPAGLVVSIKSYRRPAGDRRGAYYVRLGGLIQFSRPSRRGELKADVVIDITTRIRPGQPGYPVNAARDAFSEACGWAFESLTEELEREDEKGENKEADVYLPDGEEEADTNELASLAEQAFGDLDLQAAAQEAVRGAADFYRNFAPTEAVDTTVPSKAPPGSREWPQDDDEGSMRVVPGLANVDLDATAATVLEAVLGSADATLAINMGAGPSAGGGILSPAVQIAIEHVASNTLTNEDAHALLGAINAAEDVAVGKGGGGIAAIIQTEAARAKLGKLIKLPAEKRSPFGKAAAVRVTKAHYDRAKARRFRKNYGKWLPYLLAWDSSLRIIALAAGIRISFLPGFVLDDKVLGMCVREPTRRGAVKTVVYVNPDRFAEAVKAHAERPLALASYIHHIAVHELTHADGRMGDGHDNRFAVAREDIGVSTAHVLPAIAEICTRLFHLPDSPQAKQIRDLEKALRRVQEHRAGAQAEVKRLTRELQRTSRSRTAATDTTAAPPPASVGPRWQLLPELQARLAQFPITAQTWMRNNPEEANARFLAAQKARTPSAGRVERCGVCNGHPEDLRKRRPLSESCPGCGGTCGQRPAGATPEPMRAAIIETARLDAVSDTIKQQDAGRRTWWARQFARGSQTPGLTIKGWEWEGHADRAPTEVVEVTLAGAAGGDPSDAERLAQVAARAIGVLPRQVVDSEVAVTGRAPLTWWTRLTLHRTDVLPSFRP